MKRYIIPVMAALALCSCDDFLDREPLDFGNEDSYYKTAEDLRIAVNTFYENLPKNDALWGGLYTEDIVSDNQCATGAQTLFYKGDKLTVKMGKSSSQWNFENLRGINFYINKTIARRESGALTGNEATLDHYLGEGYFFRAYDYFRLLRNYGDAPILTQMLPDNASELVAATKRSPRNEVARFILEDLDRATEMLLETAPESGRVTRDAAYALKARVALYEASWERYHAGTCFVPGNEKWVGNRYWPGFTWKAGSAEAEVNFFLDEAIKAAAMVADNRALDSDYAGMFNNWQSEFGAKDEVILARYYKPGILTHSCSAYLSGGGGCGATRALVDSYLMTSGLPVYADRSYKGDRDGYQQMQDRDERLTASVRFPGRVINTSVGPDGKVVNDTIYFHKPNITASGREKATTGYEINKWVSTDKTQATQYLCTTAVPVFRAAECYLVYIEAYYMRHGNIDAKADKYWRELRRRAGVDEDYTKTIAATILSKENDLGVWSKGVEIDPTLYNIRRERRCELIAEGLRLDDLKRWRALDKMVNYQPEGINLWGGDTWEIWGSTLKTSTSVSQQSVSNYIHPLQISATSSAYSGYTFPKQHYLEPIPLSEFQLVGTDVLYQNPGWPDSTDGPADYSYDCD
ncbi:MAG: RagB/SusD family nutrient uptake outer membrane protein [Muribaculaceae bacterium]|nr:RagB/SusD family nutrient uptake outer membrane protein [Muribaculaceae bacterium]